MTGAPCPHFSKRLISSFRQHCISICRWLRCTPVSLLQFSVDLFLHTPPCPLVTLRCDLSRSHCWCGRLSAAPARCGRKQGEARLNPWLSLRKLRSSESCILYSSSKRNSLYLFRPLKQNYHNNPKIGAESLRHSSNGDIFPVGSLKAHGCYTSNRNKGDDRCNRQTYF